MLEKCEKVFGEQDLPADVRKGQIVPLIVKVKNCQVSLPLLLSLLGHNQPVCLLDSAGGSPQLTEYSFLGTSPLVIFRYKNSKAQIIEKDKSYYLSGNPFRLLRDLLQGLAPQIKLNLPIPFWGGAMGFLSYDAGRYIEKLPNRAEDDLFLPELYFFFPEILVILDHKNGDVYVVINQLVESDTKIAWGAAQEKMDKVCSYLNKAVEKNPRACKESQPSGHQASNKTTISSNTTQPEFKEMVEKIKEYIRAGDIYQVNISQRLETPHNDDSFVLYQKLRKVNPSPFASYLNCGDFQLVSSSPERLIMLRDGVAQTRPIAGTRRRGEDCDEDNKLLDDLILDEKERAEHIMLVDLERNDLGRVCQYGSVQVNELMVLEKYSHVIHIVSNVEGKLHGNKDQFDLIRALFPGGTITGCPKVRCMEIIEELEPVRRGPYTGSIGYFGFNGNMDMNIIIRTYVVKDNRVFMQVGAGIVIDSKPAREYFETLSKADALLAAVGCSKEVMKWEKLLT